MHVTTTSPGVSAPRTVIPIVAAPADEEMVSLYAARESTLLLLDEPTSALDPLTEETVFIRLKKAFPAACIMVAVHRMSLLPHFDMVVLMKDGRIRDAGSVEQLVERQPLFREMFRHHAAAPEQAVAQA